jgi:hypothetical protein
MAVRELAERASRWATCQSLYGARIISPVGTGGQAFAFAQGEPTPYRHFSFFILPSLAILFETPNGAFTYSACG